MFERIEKRYNFTGVDTSGQQLGGLGLSAGAGITYVVLGHTEPMELVREGSSGQSLPIPAGLTVVSGPYRDASGGAPRLIRTQNGSTDVEVIALRDDSQRFRHEPLGDVVRIDDSDPLDVESPGKSLVGIQSISNSSQSVESVNPATNGASTPVDIRIHNVGDYSFWITDGASTTGQKLKPGQSTPFDGHVATDGDLTLYPDTSNGLTAEALFLD